MILSSTSVTFDTYVTSKPRQRRYLRITS